MAKVIIIGASSGIGKELAIVCAEHGYEVGLVARRYEMLLDLQKDLKTKSYIKAVDISQTAEAITAVQSLIDEMGDVNIIIINSGVCYNNPELDWDKDAKTIAVNVSGFTAITHVCLNYFFKKNSGHLVGISSVSALRGESMTPAYSASKAYVSNYLEGIRHRMIKEKRNIIVTDIQPGWIDTIMASGEETFWMASAKEAARDIYSAIKKKRPHAYITARWRLYAWLVKLTPRWFYDRFM